MERLWAPWRMEYIEDSVEREPASCVFCDIQSPGDDRGRLVLHRGERTFVVMNRYPYNNGHLLVLPLAHVAHFDLLDDDTFLELHQLVRRCAQVLEQALHPRGLNVGLNLGHTAGAGIPAHLHYHVVPRWPGDTNFMPVIAQTKIISQHILATYDELAPHFR